MKRSLALAGLALIGCLALAAPAPPAAAAESTVTVDIKSFAFAPKEITVAPGTQVVWTNRDDTPHTVTSTDRTFASPGLDTGDTFAYTFTTAGDFTYLCTVHPYMTGVVHVKRP